MDQGCIVYVYVGLNVGERESMETEAVLHAKKDCGL